MLEGEIRALAQRLKGEAARRKDLAYSLRQVHREVSITEVDEHGETVIDDRLLERVKGDAAHTTVAGIDGGLLTRECHGIDIIMTRAVGVRFGYADGRIEHCDYLPAPIVTPTITVVSDPLSESDLRLRAGMERQMAELAAAARMARTHSPDLLLMDGSVAPHPSLQPPADSTLKDMYSALMERYVDLYKACERAGSQLAGVVEDSRGTRFSMVLADRIVPNLNPGIVNANAGDMLRRSRDTPLLAHLMEQRERTFVFKYSRRAYDHPMLRDLGTWGERVHSFYLRTAALDRPVRVDFLASAGNISRQADALAATLLAISGHHDLYGIPTVLIEADGRAKLSQDDIEMVHALIADVMGGPPGSMDLRRHGRPF